MTDSHEPEPQPVPPPAVEPPLAAEPRDARRGVIGPFSGRQLATALAVVVVAAILLVLVTRPIAPATGSGPATAIPGATPFLVGAARVGLQPGDVAPELAWTSAEGTAAELKDLDGNPVRLADLRGRTVWLNFWATWCPPCQSETPVLREMDERYRDQGLAIVAIAVQETTVDDVAAYAQRYGLAYPIAFDASANIFDLYKVYALPTQFIIGPDGRVREVVNGPLTVDSATKLLGLPPVASPSPG